MRTFEKLRREYYWPRMYRDVELHVQQCIDCSSAKGRPTNPGPSPGNVLPERPFQDSFTGYVLAKAMQDTSALAVAQAYDSTVFQRYGASSIIKTTGKTPCTD
ncbi:hypothetical protein P43SY_011231 [Pythium insidiosum]|uniref:Integrase zinc-binding domain-containing protein n=1 Tax=Pythium insidiosum TaxID=114742 RepID=A0AAD5Q2D5_PYTIN|nr:hypothetical protein P43SY_011231 [Pythium insidiosum]